MSKISPFTIFYWKLWIRMLLLMNNIAALRVFRFLVIKSSHFNILFITTTDGVVQQQAETRGPSSKQQEEPGAKHTAAHTRRSKRRTTYVMGILCARRWPLEIPDIAAWKQADQMVRTGTRRKLPLPPRSASQQNGNSPPPCTPPRHQSPPSPSPAHNNISAPTPPPPPGRAGTSASGNP